MQITFPAFLEASTKLKESTKVKYRRNKRSDRSYTQFKYYSHEYKYTLALLVVMVIKAYCSLF